ncbi:MAG: hypothetical protein KDD11_13255 [Acidobacteria bacterium]|nr:hypothetical protein [Acidobacteriota bacterium]
MKRTPESSGSLTFTWLPGRKSFKRLLQLILYPWGIWSLIAWLPRAVRRRYLQQRPWARASTHLFQWGVYLVLGLPVTVLITGEVLISLNEAVLGEQADYRLQSDWAAGASGDFEVPGPPSYTPEPVQPGQTEEFRRFLVELYSPVIYQKVANHPEWDIPLLIDFDGNDDPRDNVVDEPAFRPHVAGVYGELTAETTDSFYLTYSLYHVKDYDHPIRERISRWTYHDNDNEGFHIRVDKKSLRVVEVETWFHNRFLLFNETDRSNGTEPVHGKIHLENGTHVILYAQPQGHGVRLAQLVDRGDLEKNVKILRYRGDRPVVKIKADHSVQVDGTYEIDNFDAWYQVALGPFGDKGEGPGMFEEVIPLGTYPDGRPRQIGRFIAGRDYDINGWSRPKPMWSWDDGWDDIPIFVWHFFPSLSFQSHGGTQLSHEYLYNRPCEKVFGEPPPVVARSLELPLVRRPGDKWKPLEGRGGKMDSRLYWVVIKQWINSYINYLFHALG